MSTEKKQEQKTATMSSKPMKKTLYKCASELDYEQEDLPRVEEVVKSLLSPPAGQKPSLQMIVKLETYRIVYNGACNGHYELLYNKLVSLVKKHLDTVHTGLNDTFIKEGDNFLQHFHDIMQQYMEAVPHICHIYQPLNRQYLEPMGRCLKTELIQLLQIKVVQPNISAVLDVLTPSSNLEIPTSIITGIIKNISQLSPKNAKLVSQLFAKYNPRERSEDEASGATKKEDKAYNTSLSEVTSSIANVKLKPSRAAPRIRRKEKARPQMVTKGVQSNGGQMKSAKCNAKYECNHKDTQIEWNKLAH